MVFNHAELESRTTPEQYWTSCAREWANLADGALEGGAYGAEEYFEELASAAEYAKSQVSDRYVSA